MKFMVTVIRLATSWVSLLSIIGSCLLVNFWSFSNPWGGWSVT